MKPQKHTLKLSLMALAVFGVILSLYLLVSMNRPRYPRPEIYPDAENIKVEQTITAGGDTIRMLSFDTIAPPEIVLAYYAEHLVENYWEIREVRGDKLRLGYVNGPSNPAFSLTVTVTEHVEKTKVELQQIIDGPFSDWPSWPDYSNE